MNLQVLVIGENVAEQMAHYDGNREGPFPARIEKDQVQEMYKEHGIRVGDRQGLLTSVRKTLGWEAAFEGDDLLCEMNVNPRARWHSYVVGGRHFEVKSTSNKPAFATQARKREIVDTIRPAHAVVRNGQWHETRLWAFCDGEIVPHPPDVWEQQFNDLIAEAGDDDLLTYVSCYRSENGPTIRAETAEEKRRLERDQSIVKSMGVHYQSTIRGRANPSAEPRMLYYGVVLRIPRQEYCADPAEALRRHDVGTLASLLRPRGSEVPARTGPIERYEVWDIDTSDVWVMWRVPYARLEETNDGR